VDEAQELRLVLEASLEPEGSISGSLRGAEGEPRRFTGWLGLAAGITELAGEGDGGAATSPPHLGRARDELGPREAGPGRGGQPEPGATR
jgi:hypothetical protein